MDARIISDALAGHLRLRIDGRQQTRDHENLRPRHSTASVGRCAIPRRWEPSAGQSVPPGPKCAGCVQRGNPTETRKRLASVTAQGVGCPKGISYRAEKDAPTETPIGREHTMKICLESPTAPRSCSPA